MTHITDLITDAEIEASIASKDDPEHPDANTVAGVRETLDAINTDVIDHLDLHEDAIDDGALEVVHEDTSTVVFADNSGHFWTEQFDALDTNDEQLRSIVRELHHKAADKLCDRSWSTVYPVVLEKPELMQAGEQHVLREVARRTSEEGSVARGVDQLATEVHGWSKSMWASLTDRNPSTVTRMTQDK